MTKITTVEAVRGVVRRRSADAAVAVGQGRRSPRRRYDTLAGAVDVVARLVMTERIGGRVSRVDVPTRAVHALGSKGFRETVAHSFYRRTERAPKAAQLADAPATLGGIARHESEARDVHLRAAGWQVLDESPVPFRRTPAMKALPEPARDGTRDDLVALFNVEPEDELLLIAALAESLRPDTPELIVEFCGEQGSGKSRTASNFRALVDPHEAPLRTPPRSLPDVYVSAANNRVLAYDNVSSLSADMQDAACVISTGGASAARALYSDSDETTINVKWPVLLTSISTPFTRPDALSRVLRFECPALGKGARRSDAELSAERAPRALGYLLDTLCRALVLLPGIELDEAPRLLDFTRLGEAIARSDGLLAGHFTARYNDSLRSTATQSLEAEPVIATLDGLLAKAGGRAGGSRRRRWNRCGAISPATRRAAAPHRRRLPLAGSARCSRATRPHYG